MATTTPSLTCPQCGYVNEAERVYCHNCGAKLDRSLLPKEDDSKAKDSIEKTRRRVKKMTNPGGSVVVREAKTAAKAIAGAAVLALIVQLAREPDGVPRANTEPASRILSSEIDQAFESGQMRQLVFSEADVNAHLRSTVRAKTGGSTIPGVSFERAFVALEPGICRIGIQQSLWGFPLYSGIAYQLEVKNGVFTATQHGGNFGRVPIHPKLMQVGDFAFQKLWTALKREHEQLQKLQAIVIEKGRIMLVTKATR